MKADKEECYFWATHSGAELDLLIRKGEKRVGFEIKHTSSPKITPSMKTAIKDLKLKRLLVIHAGDKSYPMSEKIDAVAAGDILKEVEPL